MLGKYNNPTVLGLKEKVTQGIGPLTLETSLDLISLQKKREIHKDFYPIHVQNVIEFSDVFITQSGKCYVWPKYGCLQ